KNAKRGKACALPLFADAKIKQTARFAKTRPVVPRAVKGQRGAMRGQYVQENPPRFIPTGKPYFNSPPNFLR
ncbi:MAG: hypothetical protein ACOCM7_05680, partial [Bacteroidales bacterium]